MTRQPAVRQRRRLRLVVVAIIAVLIGLLLPAVQKVREATVTGSMSETRARFLGRIYRGLKPTSAPIPMRFSLTSPTTVIPTGRFTCTGTVIGAGRVVYVSLGTDDGIISHAWATSGTGGAWSVTLDSGAGAANGYTIFFADVTDDGGTYDSKFWFQEWGSHRRQ